MILTYFQNKADLDNGIKAKNFSLVLLSHLKMLYIPDGIKTFFIQLSKRVPEIQAAKKLTEKVPKTRTSLIE